MNLPLLNACVNGAATLALVAGFVAVKRKQITAHRVFMGAALALSALFLIGYLVHHARVGGHVKFQGTGLVRPVYFAILITHTPLAAIVPVAALRAVFLALKGRIEEHRRIVKWLYPVWLFVSVTGVILYLLVYVLYGPPVIAAR